MHVNDSWVWVLKDVYFKYHVTYEFHTIQHIHWVDHGKRYRPTRESKLNTSFFGQVRLNFEVNPAYQIVHSSMIDYNYKDWSMKEIASYLQLKSILKFVR